MQHGRQQLLPQAALLTEGRAALPQKVFSGLCRQRLLLKGKNRRSRGFAPEVRCEHLLYLLVVCWRCDLQPGIDSLWPNECRHIHTVRARVM